jgi:hypothetical protein
MEEMESALVYMLVFIKLIGFWLLVPKATMETMATREQLQEAVILCGAQERQVEAQQATLSDYTESWQSRAKQWSLLAIHKLQQNAVVLDELLESVDEGKPVELSNIPPTPLEYNRLLAMDKYKEQLDHPNPMNQFLASIKSNTTELLDLLLFDERVDPTVDDMCAIRFASQYGHLAVVDRLLQDKRADPSVANNSAIRLASHFGHLAVVDRLLQDPRVDPSAANNWAIQRASGYGHLAVVDRLLQDARVDPSAANNSAIRNASWNGHLAVVDRLLQDPRVDGRVLKPTQGSRNGHLAIVDRLLQDPRVDGRVLKPTL